MLRKLNKRELLAWFFAFAGAVAFTTWRPFSHWTGLPAADCFLVLLLFTCYYFNDSRALVFAILLGYCKDLLWGLHMGAGALLGLILVGVSYFWLAFFEERSSIRFFLFFGVLYALHQLFKTLLFQLLPHLGSSETGFYQMFIRNIQRAGFALPGALLFYFFLVGLFAWLYPDYKQHLSHRDELQLSEEPGQVF